MIAHLKLVIAKLRHDRFGASSERGRKLLDQLELEGGGHRIRYGEVEQRRILAEVARAPERARDGTPAWSLTTLRDALRRAEDGLPGISTYTVGRALHAAGYSWQEGRSWCETGVVLRKRKHKIGRAHV